MIYVKDRKTVLCKGDFRPAQFYKGKKKIAGYEKVTIEGERTTILENCYNDRLHNAKIHGNTVQYDTPAPDNPVGMQSVGELVTEGEHSGKYKISIKASAENEEQIFDIYLNEPLRKVPDAEDYIDFEKGVVVRSLKEHALTGNEDWYRQFFRVYCFVEYSSSDGVKMLCVSNRFAPTSWENLYQNSFLATKKIGIAQQSGGVISITPSQDVPSAEDWKAQLKAWNDEENPLTVIYYVKPTEEKIELPEIPTMRGATTYEILTEIPASMSGEYKKGGSI